MQHATRNNHATSARRLRLRDAFPQQALRWCARARRSLTVAFASDGWRTERSVFALSLCVSRRTEGYLAGRASLSSRCFSRGYMFFFPVATHVVLRCVSDRDHPSFIIIFISDQCVIWASSVSRILCVSVIDAKRKTHMFSDRSFISLLWGCALLLRAFRTIVFAWIVRPPLWRFEVSTLISRTVVVDHFSFLSGGGEVFRGVCAARSMFSCCRHHRHQISVVQN